MTEPRQQQRIRASAPGKLVLSGEYAVLDGAPAICMAVDRRARVTISTSGANHHSVIAPAFTNQCGRFVDRHGELEWIEAGEEFALLGHVWRSASVTASGGLSLVLDSHEFLDAASGSKIGIGSSAALTVALSAALCAMSDANEDVANIALVAHREFQRGLGSGADVACSYTGGLIEYRMGHATWPRLTWPDGLAYALLWSGVAVSTGAKLERLGEQVARPSRAALAYSARRLAKTWREGSASAVLNEYRDYTNVLHEFSVDHGLGIFDAGHAELAATAEAAGLVYKPCGAGGGDVGIVLADDAAAIESFVADALPQKFQILTVNLDSRGIEVKRKGN